MTLRIIVRGGGDIASGVVLRLYRAGWEVIVAELERPLAVRRYVSFAQAIYAGEITIEDTPALRVANIAEVRAALNNRRVPVIVDAGLSVASDFQPQVIVDGRMRKKPPEGEPGPASLVIGLGPGFTAGVDCQAVVETNRGPYLGRVYWKGSAQADTGIPERVGDYQVERVLRAPATGVFEPLRSIGGQVTAGDMIARVNGREITAPFNGVLRGLLQGGLQVMHGEKVGDLDPRGDPGLCWLVSDKALAVGGGVLEAILAWKPLRQELYV